MKGFNYLYLLLFIPFFLLLSSCEKEEDTIDLREEIIGIYDYRVKFYETHQGIGYLTGQDNFGTMVATKKDGDKIEFKIGNEVIFTTTKFKERKPIQVRGITFDLVEDSDIIEGQSVKVIGDYRIDFNGVNYQGVYYTNSKKLKMAQTVSYLASIYPITNRVPVTVVAITEATKQ